MSKKILVVDDAQFMRMMITDIVVSCGFEVVGEGSDGAEGVKLYKELKPDLMTLDLVMPNMTGLEALQEIMEFDPKAKVVVVSAIDQRESLMKAIKLGANDFIVKPFEESRVESAIKKALGV